MSEDLNNDHIKTDEETRKVHVFTIEDSLRGQRQEKVNDKETVTFNLDLWLEPLGGFGTFQTATIVQISLIILLVPITDLSFTLTAAPLKHRCLIKECETEGNAIKPLWLSSAIPKTEDGHDELCTRYKYLNTSTQHCDNASFSSEIEWCEMFVYETEEWTIARETWNLQCESDAWKFSFIGSLGPIARIMGNVQAGFLADRFGRKITVVYVTIVVSIIAIIKSLSVNYAMFAASEFLQCFAGSGIYPLAFVLGVEMVDPTKRLLVGCILHCVYAVGEMAFPALQWLTMDWRASLRLIHSPFLLVFVYLWTLPESTRWLLAKNRKEELIHILQKMAKVNGTTVPQECVNQLLTADLENVEKSTDKKSELIAVWNSKIMRNRFGVSLLVWGVMFYTYTGISLSAVLFSNNKYVNAISSAAIEIPANSLAFWMMGRPFFGRRYTLSGSFFLCAVASLAFAYTSEDLYWFQLVLLLCAKSGSSNACFALYVITAELSPTKFRGRATTWMVMFGCLGAVLPPQATLLSIYYGPIPLVIIGIVGALAGALSLYFPETLGAKLPETVHEAELL